MANERLLTQIADEVIMCTKCGLCQTRLHAVPGDGSAHAEIMLIGEAPGFHEDKQGHPFIGPAGKFLDELLVSMQVDRSSVFITNVVKCRPPENRDPLAEEIEACNAFLDRQIASIQPEVIITLGRFSMVKFFGNEKISAIHGKARLINNILCIAMYHPAAGLHQPALKDVIRTDFQKVPILIAEYRRSSSIEKYQEESHVKQQLSLF